MPTYDATAFDPPAPVARVVLRSLTGGGEIRDVAMLLDTGADVSLVPRDAIARLGLGESATATYQLVGFDGNVSTAQAVRLSLVLCGRVFSGRFLVIDQPLGIIGRNVLNSLSLVFDGPQLTWRPL